MAGTVKAARNHAADHIDIMVAQDYDAGTNTGKIDAMNTIPQVVDAACRTPAPGTGVIGDGRELVTVLAQGAAGVYRGR